MRGRGLFKRATVRLTLDEPEVAVVRHRPVVRVRGWAVDEADPVVAVTIDLDGVTSRPAPLDQPRPDVLTHFGLPDDRLLCGFDLTLDLRGWKTECPVRVAVTARGKSGSATSSFEVEPALTQPLPRGDYKSVWNAVAAGEADAMLAVAGHQDPAEWRRSGEAFAAKLTELVGVGPGDVVLEIGCGLGRVGEVLAPRVREWIGLDVSETMLAHAARRLAGVPNVRLVAGDGHSLNVLPDATVDVAYCTTVFMHLDEWDRWAYVREAFRVLRPGGRLSVDNINLLSDDGWAIFLAHAEGHAPADRPPNISKTSTPAELACYLTRAGFAEIRTVEDGGWVTVVGFKGVMG